MKESVEIKSYLDWSDKGRSGFLFYVIGLILAFFFFVFGGAAVLPLSSINPDYQKSLPLNVLGTLLAFVLPFFAIPLIVKILHNRPSWSVAMPRFYFARWDFFTGFWVSMVISLAFSWLLSITGVMPVETNPDFDIKQFLVVALIGFVGIFIQAGAEEMLFPGYLTQFARRFTSNKYIFIGLPASADEIAARLERAGCGDAVAAARASGERALTRSHFAAGLVASGRCRDPQQAFDRYLGRGRPAFVKGAWTRLAEALAWIAETGGVASLAHPLRYRFSGGALRRLCDEFKAEGGAALEVVTGRAHHDQVHAQAQHARRAGLAASRGSDFHAPGAPWAILGGLADLPSGLDDLAERFA